MKITFNGLVNDKSSTLTILLLNNGFSYQDPALVAILRYFESFSDQTFHLFCFKERFLLDSQAFGLKIGVKSKFAGRIPALRTGHD